MRRIPIIFFTGSLDYHEYEFDDFTHFNYVTVIRPFPFPVGGVRYRAWGAVRSLAFRKRKENFPRIWFRQVVKRAMNDGEAIAFCFTNASFEYYNAEFIDWLCNSWPQSRVYSILVDNIEGRYGEFIKDWTSRCDGVFSFDRADCYQYGWHHFWGLMPTIDRSWFIMKDTGDAFHHMTWDICFIGSDKGRYMDIRNLYERLRAGGIRCFFRIFTDRDAMDETDEEILTCQKLTFREVLEIEGNSGILLEYGARNNRAQGFTMRVMDAVGFGCGIITNNPEILNCPVYNPEKVAVIESFSDITPEMIQAILSSRATSWQHVDVFGAANIINSIEEDMAALCESSLS